MTQFQRNLVANFAGSGWSALLSLAVLPMILKLIGVEAYGLVGVFATLLSLLTPFEAGLGTALNRELAGRSVQKALQVSDGDVVRTLEVVHWGFAILCGLFIAAVAPLIAYHWVKPHDLTPGTIRTAVSIMALVIVFQWPLSLYSGGLTGLQRLVQLNVINGFAAALRSVGVVLVLFFVSPTVIAYFVWQIFASLVHTGVVAFALWRSIEKSQERPRFRPEVLRRLGRFLIGMSGTSIALLCMTQLDKVILSRVLALVMFGYYVLAASVAANLLRLVVPVQQAVFPRFAALAVSGATNELAALYHKMAQLLAVLTVPLAAIIIFFPREVLFVWTGDPVTAQHTAAILALLMSGTMVNALLYPCYTLQIAHGWTRLILITTSCAAIVLVPLLIVFALFFGARGAASVWLLLNVFFLIVLVPLMHRRLLPTEMRQWFLRDFALPIAVAFSIAGVGRLLLPPDLNRISLLILIGAIGVVAFVGTVMAAAQIWTIASATIVRLVGRYQAT